MYKKLAYLLLTSLAVSCLTNNDQAGEPVKAVFLGNTGMLLESGQIKILIDAPFKVGAPWGLVVPDSALNEKIANGAPPFNNLTAIMISHAHEDHFEPLLLERCLLNNPEAGLYIPDDLSRLLRGQFKEYPGLEDRITVIPWQANKIETLKLGTVDVKFFHALHHTPDKTHQLLFLFDFAGKKVFHAAAWAGEFPQENEVFKLKEEHIEVAFLHYFFFDKTRVRPAETRSLIDTYIAPARIHVFHIYGLARDKSRIDETINEYKQYYPEIDYSYNLMDTILL